MIFKVRFMLAILNVIYLTLERIVLLIYKKPRSGPTPITKSLFTSSATTIAKKIREREVIRPLYISFYRDVYSIFSLYRTVITLQNYHLFHENQITSYEVVSEYIERIKEVNFSLNAVVDDRFEDAIFEAKKCDDQLRSCKLDLEKLEKEKPLFGVPCTIKESIGVKGTRFYNI